MQSAVVGYRSAIEPLEDRQMLSVTLDLRTNIGTKQAVVTSVGQVVTLDLYAIVTGTKPAASTTDGMLSATGSFLSTETNTTTSVAGDLGNPNVNPDYAALGASDGTIQDLNSDGNKDIGSNNNNDIAGFWNDRAGGLQTDGAQSGNSSTYFLGSVDYTVTSLHYGQETDVNFRFRSGIPSGAFDAVWEEDGNGENDQIGTALVGTPVTFTDPNLTVPGSATIGGTVSKVVSGTTSAFSGVTVFLDSNNNGVLDSGEPSAVTTSTGAYSFTKLVAGSYYLREVVPTGYKQTSPANTPSLVTVSTGQSVTGQNFTDTSTAVTNTASIAGTVSKVVSGVTSAFAGVTVYLDTDGSGTLTTGDTSTTTTSTGTYSFTGLAAGTYKVREVVPTGYTQTSPSTTPTTVTLTAAQASTGDNFTDTLVTTASISGTVSKVVSGVTSAFSGVVMYLDSNDNGTLDSGEPSVTTSSTGTYSLTGLAAGTYYLREVVPTGYTLPQTQPVEIILTTGQTVVGQNFFDTANTVVSTGSIAGTVSKVVSGATSAFAGVTVFLDTNGNGTLDTGEVSTTTSSTGTYSFTGLAASTYHVTEVAPSGYTQTSPAGAVAVTLSSGQSVTGTNFVDTANVVTTGGSISGTVTKLVSGISSAEAGVTMYLDKNNNGTLDSGEVSTTTSSTGTYTLSGLSAGTYFLREVVPSGYSLTAPATQPVQITLVTNQVVVGQNFSNTATVTTGGSSISGTVYIDSNSNGKLDSGEAGIPNVEIYYDANDDSIPDAGDIIETTSATGTYSFTGLTTGSYLLREVLPTGSKLTNPSKGYVNVGVGSNWVIAGENWGNTTPTVVTTGSIAGTVSKVVSGSSSAFSGVTVFLDTNGNGVLDSGELSTTTSSTGAYSFAGLAAGTYSVREVVPTGYTQTTPSGAISVAIVAGQSATGENFVDTASTVVSTGSISGTVTKVVSGVSSADAGVTMYLDINNDGSFDSGDISTTTSSTGAYTFSGLAAGTYQVRQVVATGYTQTSPTTSPTTVVLTTGQAATGENFIDTAATITNTSITLSGEVFNDANGNGVLDSGETGLTGWTVYCDLNNDGKFETNESYKVTPSNGKYSFIALKAGTYTLRIVPETGYKGTLPASGFYTVVLTAGSNVVENFGEEKT